MCPVLVSTYVCVNIAYVLILRVLVIIIIICDWSVSGAVLSAGYCLLVLMMGSHKFIPRVK